MNKNLSVLVTIFLLINWNIGEVNAQDIQPSFAEYVIQPGDSLSKISQKFNISLDDLITENEISDPNQVFEGTILTLRGVNWVVGLLDTQIMQFGESSKSLMRRYHIDLNTLSRLNGLASPSQLYLGNAVLLPTQRNEDWESGRWGVGIQESMFETSIISGINPWEVVAANQLKGRWDSIPGDIVLLPGTNDPGPGAFPSQISNIEFEEEQFVQGNTAVLKLTSKQPAIEIKGSFSEKPLNFLISENGQYIALQGIHAFQPAGLAPISITIKNDGKYTIKYQQWINVRKGDFEFEKISIDPAFLDVEKGEIEDLLLNSIVANISPTKYWSNVFIPPTPYPDSINSFFGTRRSYNDSPYNYYHTGVDYGAGTGVEISAPAAGVVVLAQLLEIRGNVIIIDHGWGIYTGYFHQSEILVEVGDVVEPGQVIGLIGSTGRSSGAHLHWELWASGIQVNALNWLVNIFP